MPRSGPRKDPSAPAKWDEVWWWCAEIEKRWGYWAKVIITPPLPTKDPVRFNVCVVLEILSVQDPRLRTKVEKWRSVRGEGLTAEFTALQLVVELHRALDTEELERERAALEAGALL